MLGCAGVLPNLHTNGTVILTIPGLGTYKLLPYYDTHTNSVPHYAGYSAVEPGAWIRPHFGETNAQLKLHFGLIVPTNGSGQVGICVCVRARARVCVCVRACAGVCMCACARARVTVFVCALQALCVAEGRNARGRVIGCPRRR